MECKVESVEWCEFLEYELESVEVVCACGLGFDVQLIDVDLERHFDDDQK